MVTNSLTFQIHSFHLDRHVYTFTCPCISLSQTVACLHIELHVNMLTLTKKLTISFIYLKTITFTPTHMVKNHLIQIHSHINKITQKNTFAPSVLTSRLNEITGLQIHSYRWTHWNIYFKHRNLHLKNALIHEHAHTYSVTQRHTHILNTCSYINSLPYTLSNLPTNSITFKDTCRYVLVIL